MVAERAEEAALEGAEEGGLDGEVEVEKRGKEVLSMEMDGLGRGVCVREDRVEDLALEVEDYGELCGVRCEGCVFC